MSSRDKPLQTHDVTDAEAGRTCPYCQFPLKAGGSATACPTCGAIHHTECWRENAGCAVLACDSAPTPSGATPSAGRGSVTREPVTRVDRPTIERPAPAVVSASRNGKGLTIAVAALALAVAGVAAGLLLGGHSGNSSTGKTTTASSASKSRASNKTTTSKKTSTTSTPPGPTTIYTGDGFTLRRPTGWLTLASEVNHGSYTESRWALPGQPTAVQLLIDYSPGIGDITPTQGGNPQRDAVLNSPDYDELNWSLQNFPAGQGRVWQFIWDSEEEEIDTFFVACGTGYGILGKAPTDEFYDFRALFADATSSFRPTCESG